MKNRVLVAAILCLISAVSWGAMFPVANHAFHHLDPFYFTLFRYGLVTIILLVWLFWKEGINAFRFEGKGWHLWFFGTMAFTVYNLLIFWGQDLLGNPGTMIASIMESLMPMISIVIAWVFIRQRPQAFTIFCVVIGFVGASLVVTKGNFGTFFTETNDIIPSLLILLAVIGWVVYTMGGGKFSNDGWSALRYSTLSCLLGTVTAAIVVFVATLTGYVSVPTVETMIITSPHIAFMVIFPGVIALVGWNYGVSVITPLNGLLFLNFVPVTTLVIQIFQGASITAYDYIGTIFIIVSLLLNNVYLRLQQKRREPKEEFKGRLQEREA
ncbi:DMT family transporter [Sporosarcina highlanderae]|uniref:DMT family transporter n=1 Tax=Sporosarcina highlanderae TaxID=3035916 RepID=A0ABT8JMK4_9BACL|nr:DMT family transporter [Sporosarcina highlanderae]MDN4606300.1 DMT family transporter [Sporosarcina highlanderae]